MTREWRSQSQAARDQGSLVLNTHHPPVAISRCADADVLRSQHDHSPRTASTAPARDMALSIRELREQRLADAVKKASGVHHPTR
jgi:hypothetical protein